MLEYLDSKKISKDVRELIQYTKNTNYKYKNQVLDYLNTILNGRCTLYCNIDVLKNIIDIAIFNQDSMEFYNCNKIAVYIYNKNVPIEPTKICLKDFYNLYNSLINFKFSDSGEYQPIVDTINDIYHSFENKELFFQLLKEVENIVEVPARKNYLCCLDYYIEEARIFYHDEYAYLKTLINLLYAYDDDYNKNINLNHEQIRLDKKLAGIYDIDEEKIKELETKIKLLEDMLEKSNKKINELNKKCDDLGNNNILNFNDNISLFNAIFNSQETILMTKFQTINNNFKIHTDDRLWLTNDVVNTFGLEYVANTNLDDQTFISYIVKNNLLEKWQELLKINSELNFGTSYFWFNNKTIDILGLDYLAHTTKDTQEQISKYSKRRLNLLKEIITINPKFQFYNYPYLNFYKRKIINYHTTKILGMDYIANVNKNQMLSIMTFYVAKKPNMLLKLKEILTLEPNFAIMFDDFNFWGMKNLHYIINNSSREEIIKLLSDKKYCRILTHYNFNFIEELFFLSYNSRTEMLSNSYNNDNYCEDYKTLKKFVRKEKKEKLYHKTFPKNKCHGMDIEY